MKASSSPSWFDDLQISDGTFPVAVRPEKPPPAPYRCANCDALCTPTDRFHRRYCPDGPCRATAKAVRYARGTHDRYGPVLPADVRKAVHRKTALALAGGYPVRRRALRPFTREQVWSRDAFRCVLCGQPGAEIDHIDGDSSELTNLQLLCAPCHDRKTDQHIGPIPADRPDVLARAALLRRRILAPVPLRPCDDHRTWDERGRDR